MTAASLTEIPVAIQNSRLMSQGGFNVYEGLHDRVFFQQLIAEAQAQYGAATACDVAIHDGEEIRGGVPERRFLSSSGSVVQDSFYWAPWVLDLLRDLTSPELVPSGKRGTYSYYHRQGDFLGIHRDIEACDVAVITCLIDGVSKRNDSGSLCLYPLRLAEPLSHVRSTPEKDALNLHPSVGQTIIMYGGLIPHTLLPVSAGESRVVSVLCYHIPQS